MRPDTVFVTATIGRKSLRDTCRAVRAQTKHCSHVVFIHGLEYRDAALETLRDFPEVIKIQLPTNLGRDGLGASPLYAAAPFLLPHEFLLFCDDDNWPEPQHAESLTDLLKEHDCDWGYSLRNICADDGTFLTQDSCESVGAFENLDGLLLVDQSCFVLRRSLALRMTQPWLTPGIADRILLQELLKSGHTFAGSGLYSMNYRLSQDGSQSLNVEALCAGNAQMRREVSAQLPWEYKHTGVLSGHDIKICSYSNSCR